MAMSTQASLRIAEKCQDRIADVLIDGRAVGQSNLRHLGQVVVQQDCEFLRLEIVCRRGEIRNVREEYRQLLSARRNFHFFRASKYR